MDAAGRQSLKAHSLNICSDKIVIISMCSREEAAQSALDEQGGPPEGAQSTCSMPLDTIPGQFWCCMSDHVGASAAGSEGRSEDVAESGLACVAE